MKRVILFLLIFSAFKVDAQITTRKLLGFNPINGQPYIYPDTLRTIYYHSPMQAIGDTVFLDTTNLGGGGGGQWTLIGNNIRNSNTGKVGINIDTSHAQLEVVTPTNTTQLIDSTGITLSTKFPATLATSLRSPGPLVFRACRRYRHSRAAASSQCRKDRSAGRPDCAPCLPPAPNLGPRG